jgi:hypothetical protein
MTFEYLFVIALGHMPTYQRDESGKKEEKPAHVLVYNVYLNIYIY